MKNIHPPFFIIGTGRCGTQLLRNMLQKNPQVKVLPETHFIPILYEKFKLKPISFDQYYQVINNIYGGAGEHWLEVLLNKADQNQQTFYQQFKTHASQLKVKNIKNLTEAFFKFLYPNAKYFGDKTPDYGCNIKVIKKIWPQAKFILLLRDPLDTALSMKSHPGFIRLINGKVTPRNISLLKQNRQLQKFSSKKVSFKAAAIFWEQLITSIVAEIKTLNNQDLLIIKYEDLLIFPDKVLTQINKFLKLTKTQWIHQAAKLPRPFPEKNQINKTNKKYVNYFSPKTQQLLKNWGYPYNLQLKTRSPKKLLKEILKYRFQLYQKIPFYIRKKWLKKIDLY
ncbi:MAG: hypothetical protein GF390_00920 [Candidatus Pacebacteria bacterium]|nr:hypothetical protein [Candidatus Paceibacterota bacterium]